VNFREITIPGVADADKVRVYASANGQLAAKTEDGSITPLAGGVGETAAVVRGCYKKEFHRLLASATPEDVWVVSIPADSVVHVEGHVGVYAGGTGDANDDYHIVTGTEVRALSAVGPTGANVTALTHTDSGDSFAIDLTWDDGAPGTLTVTATGDTGALLAGYLEVRIYALDCTVDAG
jgi:hypothetical protein